MKRLALLASLFAALLVRPQSAHATYTYYGTDNLSSANNSAPNWTFNGTSTNSGSAGLTASSANGGSYISKAGPPDGTSQYEVAATLKLGSSGGSYVLYLEATANALLGQTSTGSFYAVSVSNPTFANGGCTATASLYKTVNGSVSLIASTTVPCADGVVYHAAFGNDQALHFWANDVEYFNWSDTQSLTGFPGIGGYSMPAGNGINLVQLGPCDRANPSQIDANSVQTYPLSNRIDLQTAGSADDSNGTGIDSYRWFRNNVAIATTRVPEWSDTGIAAGTSYNYAVQAQDHHGNLSALTSFTVIAPVNASVDARQVGVRPTGSYWGGLGEQIDMRSGNLNFTYPLLTAMSRGWSAPLHLSYNSQNWRLDSNGKAWKLGADTGVGFGWKMQFGSLTAFYSSYFSLQYYEYADSTGATYHLDQNNNGIWTSTESAYVTYDANAQRLYFNNGTFWVLGCVSAGTEGDAGTMYPTLMQDSNGNQITIRYAAGAGVTWLNSSARITQIIDVRPGTNPTNGPTFTFTYNSDAVPHLIGIGNSINSKDSFAFSYAASITLADPFASGATFGNSQLLNSATNNATSLTSGFTYSSSNSGELAQITFPLGGHIRWEYNNGVHSQSTVREVLNRYLQWDSNVGERAYSFTAGGSASDNFSASRQVLDAHANAFKNWQFKQTPGLGFGLVSTYLEGKSTPAQTLQTTNYSWANDPAGNSYIGRLQAISDPGQSYAVTNQRDQTVDQFGNVTQTKLYDFTDLANPAKIYNTTYLTSANGNDYTSLYIRNRVASVTLTDRNNVTTTLKQNTYDQYPTGISPTNNIQQQDADDYGPGYFARGNVYGEATPSTSWHHNYNQAGTPLWTGQDVNPNRYVSRVTSPQTNYAAPDLITTSNSLNTQMGWSRSLQMTGRTGANQESSSVSYDQSDRPAVVSSPYGAQTIYQYSVSAPQITATTNSRFTKTYLDGLGRVAKIERGDTAGTKSAQETLYDTCGCNAIGKAFQKSMPHVPGGASVSSVSTFDALGRLLTATKPDGHSVTTYSYAGRAVTVTDPAGKWKKLTRDAFGQIVRVEEQSPSSSEPNHVTLYSYDVFGHLTHVRMDRTIGGVVRTQHRTWTYSPQTLRLLSKTSPEAGTVTYTYNNEDLLSTVTDAKNQRKVLTYDTYGRITQIARGTVASGTFTEDIAQRTNYTYEGTNGDYSSGTNGRVSKVTYQGPHGLSFAEMYSYHNAGGVTKKRLQINGPSFGSSTINMDANYTYNGRGQLLTSIYPASQFNSDGTSSGAKRFDYTYDSMNRLYGMNDQQTNTSYVSSVLYGPADEMLQLNAAAFSETHTYNANLQLTELTSGSSIHRRYNYSVTQNNGQIMSQEDVLSGETIAYQYDSLKRLIQASAIGDPSGSWSQAFTFDGFGNLTQKTSNNAPSLTVAVDWSTNRLQSFANYDNNGNMTAYAGDVYGYDLQNRMVQASPSSGGTVLYGYNTTNHRIYKGSYSGGAYSAEEIYFYGAEGHKYGVWQVNPSSGVLLQASVIKQWFGPRLLSPEDRLGSRGKYFAYGEERNNVSPANPLNDQEKFATYTRDSATGLDYANQRYYSSMIGRFMRSDPYGGSANPRRPQTWNRYGYVGNDPANRIDPLGLYEDYDGSDPAEEYAYVDGGGYSDDSGPVYIPDAGVPTFTDTATAYTPETAPPSVYDVPIDNPEIITQVANNTEQFPAFAASFLAGSATLGAGVASLPAATLTTLGDIAPTGSEVIVNLGGEGEVAGNIINFQPGAFGGNVDWAVENGANIAARSGQPVVLGQGNALPFASGSVNEVILNNVPVGTGSGYFGPSLNPLEINRILAEGGVVTGSSATAYYDFFK